MNSRTLCNTTARLFLRRQPLCARRSHATQRLEAFQVLTLWSVSTHPPPFLRSVAVSPNGERVYVADSGNNRIRQVDALTGAVTTLAGSGASGFLDGPVSSAKFYGPRGVAVSPDGGTVYVADYSNFRLRAIDITNGEVTTLMDASDEVARPGSGSPTGARRARVGCVACAAEAAPAEGPRATRP